MLPLGLTSQFHRRLAVSLGLGLGLCGTARAFHLLRLALRFLLGFGQALGLGGGLLRGYFANVGILLGATGELGGGLRPLEVFPRLGLAGKLGILQDAGIVGQHLALGVSQGFPVGLPRCLGGLGRLGFGFGLGFGELFGFSGLVWLFGRDRRRHRRGLGAGGRVLFGEHGGLAGGLRAGEFLNGSGLAGDAQGFGFIDGEGGAGRSADILRGHKFHLREGGLPGVSAEARPGIRGKAGRAFDRIEPLAPAAKINGSVWGEGRRGRNRRVGGKLPDLHAHGTDRVEAVVVRAKIERAIPAHRRRGAHPSAGGIGPQLEAIRRKRVKLAVVGADVNDAIGADGRRPAHRRARGCSPSLGAVGVDGIHMPIEGTEINGPVRGECRGGVHFLPGCKSPLFLAGQIQRVKRAAQGNGIGRAIAPDHRRGHDRVVGRELPALRAVRVHRVNGIAHRAEMHGSIESDRGRRNNLAIGTEPPALDAIRAHGVELAVQRANDHRPIHRNGRGCDDRVAGRKLPLALPLRVERV